jgi:hypothetical protein
MSPSTGATLRQERGGAIKKSQPHAISFAEMLRFGCYQRSVNTKTMLNRAHCTPAYYFLSKRANAEVHFTGGAPAAFVAHSCKVD